MDTTQTRSGWPTFAGVVAAIVGVWHVLSGIAAITEDELTEEIAELMYGVDITAWGWFWVVIGALQIVAGVLIFARNPIGLIVGALFAVISASFAVFMIFAAPLWALAVLGLDVAVLWALLAYSDEFTTA